jgi:hypothetical protein
MQWHGRQCVTSQIRCLDVCGHLLPAPFGPSVLSSVLQSMYRPAHRSVEHERRRARFEFRSPFRASGARCRRTPLRQSTPNTAELGIDGRAGRPARLAHPHTGDTTAGTHFGKQQPHRKPRRLPQAEQPLPHHAGVRSGSGVMRTHSRSLPRPSARCNHQRPGKPSGRYDEVTILSWSPARVADSWIEPVGNSMTYFAPRVYSGPTRQGFRHSWIRTTRSSFPT